MPRAVRNLRISHFLLARQPSSMAATRRPSCTQYPAGVFRAGSRMPTAVRTLPGPTAPRRVDGTGLAGCNVPACAGRELLMSVPTTGSPASNPTLAKWVEETAKHCQPDRIHWCDGSPGEYQEMLRLMIQAGTAIPLDEEKRPGSILVRSDPGDVARVEDRTFICSLLAVRRRPDQQLEEPGRDARHHGPALRRVHEGAHPVRDPLQHGTGRARRSPASASRSPTPPTSSPTCTP